MEVISTMSDIDLVKLMVFMFIAALVLGMLIFTLKTWIRSKISGRSDRVSELERRIEQLERERRD